MGYVTDSSGRLCCDHCGRAGGVRRCKCPAGYCQGANLCPECRRNPAVKAKIRDMHANCAEASARFQDRQARTRAALDRGEAVRISALMHARPADAVRVIFRDARGHESGADMTHATYDALPLLEPATLADYALVARTLGQPEPTTAPATFAGL